jgi:hypothetical protein
VPRVRPVGFEAARTDNAAVPAKEKTIPVAQPTDVIPGSMKWPEPRQQNARYNKTTDGSQER